MRYENNQMRQDENYNEERQLTDVFCWGKMPLPQYQRLCEINFGEKFVDDTRGGAKECCPTRGRLPLTVASGGKSVRRKEIVLAWFAGEGMFTMATPRR